MHCERDSPMPVNRKRALILLINLPSSARAQERHHTRHRKARKKEKKEGPDAMNRILTLLTALVLAPLVVATGRAQPADYKGDVTDVRVVRRVEQHPDSWRVWQPFIIQG